MAIDRITVGTIDPLAMASTDYRFGEVTTIYVRHKSQRWLILGVVELLPPYAERRIEVPNADDQSCTRIPGSELELNLRRTVVPSDDALDWYRTARDATDYIQLLPVAADAAAKAKAKLEVRAGPFDGEPPPPLFSFESVPFWLDYPFWGARPGGSRWRWATPLTSDTPDFTATEREYAGKWLLERVFVDPFSRPTLLGSLHLRLPNPILRSVRERLGNNSRVLIEAIPYPECHLDSLTLQLVDFRPMGPAAVWTGPIRSQRMQIKLEAEPHKLQTLIWCTQRGLLYATEPTPFMGSVHIDMKLGTGTRRVSVPTRSKRREAETYEVPVVHNHPILVGESARGALRHVLEDQEFEAGRRHLARSGQRLFNDETDAATIFVRDLIGRASASALIVDPYFGHVDLMSFALANATEGVFVRVLTSCEFLRTKSGEGVPFGELLVQTVERVKNQGTSVDVRVSRGRIHDRFLVLDAEVWMLGSSLNEFGARATLAVKVPYPPPVIDLLNRAWATAQHLHEFVTETNRELP